MGPRASSVISLSGIAPVRTGPFLTDRRLVIADPVQG